MHPRRVKKKPPEKAISQTTSAEYGGLIGGIAELLEASRRSAARMVNVLMTATYWEIGRRIVEFEQRGEVRAQYGKQLLTRLSADLRSRCGRGFAVDNLERFRSFFLNYPPDTISATLSRKLQESNTEVGVELVQTLSGQSLSSNSETASRKSAERKRATMLLKSGEPGIRQTVSGQSLVLGDLAAAFPLPWSHYVRLLSVKSEPARDFYHAEALRSGWSVRQLASRFFAVVASACDFFIRFDLRRSRFPDTNNPNYSSAIGDNR